MNFLKFSGLILTIVGVVLILLFILSSPPSKSLVSAWLIWSLLSFSQILPLIGLGIGFSLLSLRLFLLASVTFVVGFFMGYLYYKSVWIYFANRADVTEHLYLTLPISSLFVGILLLLPQSIRHQFAVLVSFVVGAMLAITIKLTDPTLHDSLIPKLGFLVAVWIVLSTMLNIRFFYQKWFVIPMRILGSWLIASAILYGGTALGVKCGYIMSKSKEAIKKEQVPDVGLVPDFN